MRKLKLQTQVSIDGFLGGPNGEMDWIEFGWDEKLKTFVNELHDPVDCILMGRTFAGGFIPHWAEKTKDQTSEEYEFANLMNDSEKVVFSRDNSEFTVPSDWKNTRYAGSDLEKEIKGLKSSDGGDIIAYGGSAFVSSLIAADMIDELNLFVNPTALGAGMPVFHGHTEKKTYKLFDAIPFECGIVVLRYTNR